MKVTAYRNYGILGYEKRPFYTINGPSPMAVVSEKVTITLPKEWNAVKNEVGTPDGEIPIAEQVIDNKCSSDVGRQVPPILYLILNFLRNFRNRISCQNLNILNRRFWMM